MVDANCNHANAAKIKGFVFLFVVQEIRKKKEEE
jgi:hypothetical protein